ncbi:ankyrin repeat domain-containing protein 12-like [Nymphalis io]|uniref:ankyrin repeat domain-containing protein 12-like n=1 Tax=Inachis io TaxID=171585 RepID=UPI002169BA11|nr:ankyrin repeat domain-containing protein 12-like [Nymphalis io]
MGNPQSAQFHNLRKFGHFLDLETSRNAAQTESQQHDISITGSLNATPIGGEKTENDNEKSKSFVGIAQRSLQKDFSFFFIKPDNKQLQTPNKYKSSSELIKETKDMIRERSEKEKTKQLPNIKFNEKEKKLLKVDDSKHKKKDKTLEKTKEKMSLGNEQKLLDIETQKITTDEPESDKKIKENIKKEKDKQIKSEKKKKIDNKDLINADKGLTKLKKESDKREKVEKTVIEKELKNKVNEQNNKTKKEPPVAVNKKEELKDEENKPKQDTNKGSSTKDNIEEYKKLLAEQKKQKEEEKLKIKEEEKIKKKEEEEKMKKREEERQKKGPVNKLQIDKEPKSEIKFELKTKTEIKKKETSELKANQPKVRNPSSDDLILQLVKLKQSQNKQKPRVQPKRLSEIKIDPTVIKAHKGHQEQKQSNCLICNDSELELDIENIEKSKYQGKEVTDIIIGQQIFKCKPHLEEHMNKTSVGPILFTSTFHDDVDRSHDVISDSAAGDMERKPFSAKIVDQEVPKGIIRYALSDRTFIDKGWTMLPTEKVVRKMNVYRMRPAHPEFDWFEHNKNKKLMHYDTGEKLAEFDDDGRGRWFYRNGKLALDYYDAKEINAQQRFVIYSSGEPDERGHSRPLVILATFDYLGNGIVFDHAGKIRLKYNQTEGVILDRNIGPVSHWKWHTLNDPPVLQQVMIDTQMAHKDPEIIKLGGPGDDKPRPDNEEMLAIEFDNFIKEKSKKLSQKFKPFQIKMKALKINEHFSLRVLDQATVYLIFRDGSINLKINIGMILDHKEIVDTDTAEVGEVSNSLERFPARTDSLAGLQKSVAYAQRVERARVERERRLRPTMSYTDKVNTMVSRPLRTPLDRVPSSSTVTTSAYSCRCRKSSSCHLYYDTRLS